MLIKSSWLNSSLELALLTQEGLGKKKMGLITEVSYQEGTPPRCCMDGMIGDLRRST